MRFIHPEYLWALFALLIPLIIHLFRLRRFKRTPFTNVPFLKEVIAESRKSKTLKKWLLLATRLLLLACLVLAFSRPYLFNPGRKSSGKLLVYLDNSRSMEIRGDDQSLLQRAITDLLNTGSDKKLSLLTNDQEFRDVRLEEIRNDLLELGYSDNPLNPGEVQVRLQRLVNEAEGNRVLIISDFQDSAVSRLAGLEPAFVLLRPDVVKNISIDSAWITENDALSIRLSRIGSHDETPVSLYNQDTLIARAAVDWKDAAEQDITFSIPQEKNLLGRVSISDNGLQYDNTLYLNLDRSSPVKVLSIGDKLSTPLSRIFSTPSFEFDQTRITGINYATLPEKDLIILDHIENIPSGLSAALQVFREQGGMIVLAPAAGMDPAAFNPFLTSVSNLRLNALREDSLQITTINFDHPYLEEIFQSTVENFKYPRVDAYFPVVSTSPRLLEFQGGLPFLLGDQNFFLFTAPIHDEYSNFTQSPLIVPIFYALGMNSRKTKRIYYRTGEPALLDVPVQLSGDKILRLRGAGSEIIPRQQNYANKTRLDFSGIAPVPGHYQVFQGDQPLSYLSFNSGRSESVLEYPEFTPEGSTVFESVAEAMDEYEKSDSLDELWKWFVILALLFLLAETAIQKFMK